jgi:hypothetical protein
MLQLDHGDGGEHDFGFTVDLFQGNQQVTHRSGVTLGDDEHTGIQN